jgi:hypothetical protein
MSIEAIHWAFNQPIKKSSTKLMLLALADYANEQNICYPSFKTLEVKCCCARSTINEAILELQKFNFIRKINAVDYIPKVTNKGQNCYELMVRKSYQYENPTSTKNSKKAVRFSEESSTKIGTNPSGTINETLSLSNDRGAREKNSHAHAQKTTTENSDKNSRFKKPTTDEIQTYVNQQNLINFDTRHFFDHYESNGWIVGKTKMKSWQHAVQNWHRRSHKFDNHNGSNAKNQSQSVPRNDLEGNSDYYNDLDQIPF